MTFERDQDDWLLRVIAAAPPTKPPSRSLTAVVVEPRNAAVIGRVRERAASLGIAVSEQSDGTLFAVVTSDRINAAASSVLALHGSFRDARIAVVTGSADGPGATAFDHLLERAANLLAVGSSSSFVLVDQPTANALDARFEVRSDATSHQLVGERKQDGIVDVTRGSFVSETEARIARAIEEERLVNTGRLFILFLAGLVLVVINSAFLARAGAPEQRLVTPVEAVWFAVTVARVIAMRVRPSTRRWIRYSLLLVDIPLQAVVQYVVLQAAASPQEVAALTLAVVMPYVAAAQFVFPPRVVVALASVLFVETSVWFALAGQWPFFGIGLIYVGGLAAVAIYGQSRTKRLVIRMIADTEASNRELKRLVAERSRDLSEALAQLASAPSAARLGPGDVVEHRYRIVRRIGAGGMGQVYEVERLADGKRLALKTLTGAVHPEALARFAREAQIAAELDAPNLVAAVDVGVTGSGTLFLVMELVAGASLAAARDRYGDFRWAAPILAQVARALSAMHGHGIVHRDLKPSNILLHGATAKVTDFGIAGLVGDDSPAEAPAGALSPTLTRTGALLGTPLYMAPELASGARAAAPAADMFSFGVVAYELLAAKLPHEAPPVIERLAGRALPSPIALAAANPDLPAELGALVDRCLAESPDARPTAPAVASMFDAIALA